MNAPAVTCGGSGFTHENEAAELVPIAGGFHVKDLGDGRCVDVLRMLYNWRLVVSTPDHQCVEHGWCYYGHGVTPAGAPRTMESAFLIAVIAAAAWDGCGAPAGFDKQAV